MVDGEVGEDGEYAPDEGSSDDEETIAKDEKEVDDKEQDDEIDMLANEADIPIEEQLKHFHPDKFKDIEVEKKKENEGEAEGQGREV